MKGCNVCSAYFFLTNNYSGLLQVGFFFLAGELLWLLAVVQPMQAFAQLGFCSQAPQPNQPGQRGSVTHRHRPAFWPDCYFKHLDSFM